MLFLVDEDLPRSTNNILRQHGHKAIDVRDIGLRGASDAEIAVYLCSRTWIMPADWRHGFYRYPELFTWAVPGNNSFAPAG